jgi:hypothetical protein
MTCGSRILSVCAVLTLKGNFWVVQLIRRVSADTRAHRLERNTLPNKVTPLLRAQVAVHCGARNVPPGGFVRAPQRQAVTAARGGHQRAVGTEREREDRTSLCELTQWSPAVRVDQNHFVLGDTHELTARYSYESPVPAERNAQRIRALCGHGLNGIPAGHVPDVERATVSGRGDPCPVRGERKLLHRHTASRERLPGRPTSTQVPKDNRTLAARGRQQLAVWAECDRDHVALRHRQGLSRLRPTLNVPQHGLPIVTSRGQEPTVWAERCEHRTRVRPERLA